MNLTYTLKALYRKVRNRYASDFRITLQKKKEILDSFPEPKDDFERSYFQYKSLMKAYGRLIEILLDIVSIPLIPYFLIKLRYQSKKLIYKNIADYDAVFLSSGIIIDTIPDSIKYSYPRIIVENFIDCMSLSNSDICYLKKIFYRYPFDYHLLLKAIMKISIYSAQMNKYNPRAIISYTDGSFTSSIATMYCEHHNVKHINIMHGERYFSLFYTFFRFSKYYVWDEKYADLFKELRADSSQFIIEQPKTLKLNLNADIVPKYYITYYLADEDVNTLHLIKDCFEKLKAQGKICAIRLHPRYGNYRQINHIFKDHLIELPTDVSIKESFENTQYISSLRSTVIFEGYSNGKEVIIDDITQPEKYRKLIELRYVMLNKPHHLLSEILEESK